MYDLLDILASGVHDAKNQLFVAESLIASAELEHGLDMGEARYAVEAAAERLSRTLTAYRLLRQGEQASICPVIVGDLCAEIALAQQRHLAAKHIRLEVDCQVIDECLFDRDLVTDMLNNAVQNAARFARSEVRLGAWLDGETTVFRVEDDGPGYASLPPSFGIGLMVAERLAIIHHRQGRHGSLHLTNGGRLGGACFEVRLP
jgi:signal transduction histidine kinase